MFPYGWYLILIAPLAIIYSFVIWRRIFNLEKQFQLQGGSVKNYLLWLIHNKRERRYILGNFASVGVQTLIWMAASTLRDPYGYSVIIVLLISIFTNWLIAILSLTFSPYSPEIVQVTLAHRAARPVMLSVILSGLLSLSLFGILVPSSLSTLTSSPLYYIYSLSIYWTVYGALIMLLTTPLMLVISKLITIH